MVRKLVLAIAAASALMSSNVAQALGVGEINLRSALNQPLDAEIELLQVRDLSSQEILPALASPDEFGRAGIARDFFLTDLVFTPVVRPDGRAVIRVTSSRPVKEPFLNFLMEVRWPSGRVLREFTLLLDPPLYSPTPVTAAAPIAAPVQRPVPTVAPGQPRRPQAQAPATVAAAQPIRQPTQQGSGEWRTSRSDTLWEIALRSRPSGASVHQTMLAIQELNPNAFIDNNINRLKADQTLTLPDAEQARRLGQAEAVAQVAAQNRAWQAGRQATPAQRQLDARQQASAAAAPETAPAGDSLRLVAGSAEQGNGSSESARTDADSRLRDQLDETKEQLDSLEREKTEADSRLADMQTQMETLQRLLELKDAQLAAMQEQLGDAAETPDVAPSIAPELETSEESTAAMLADQEVQDAELPAVDESGLPAEGIDAPADSLADMPEGAETPIELDATAADTGLASPASAESDPAPAPVVAEQESADENGIEALLQRMMQNQTFLIVGGGIVLLLLLLLLMALARRNARREAEMADNFIARAAEKKDYDGSDDSDAFNVALAGFDDEPSAQNLGINHDPITEADALIAYGKLAEAAEVLNAAIDVEPERIDLRFKLLEVQGLLEHSEGYAEQVVALRNMGASESQIAAMNARFPIMAAALAGGAVIADEYPAQDPLLDSQTLDVEEVAEEDDLGVIDYDLDGLDIDEAATGDTAAPMVDLDHDLDLDFDLDENLAKDLADPGVTTTASQSSDDDFELGFNLDDNLDDVSPAPKPGPDLDSDFTLDEDFDLSLTDDLQADSLMAEMDAMGQSGADTAEETEKTDGTLNLSDEELMRFEQELNEAESDEISFVELEAAEPDNAAAESTELDDLEEDESAPSSTAEQVLADSMAEEDEDEFDFLSGTDECATKLDLARAYIDMGDQEGARDILAEVLDEGSDQQKQDAREMMGQLD
ncbi:FimV/HubP family polar landmark protein [Halopseudomonas pelagia]|uniref:FimV/HubP family polar landmark protein n=1 Tax=Halopseudomonas pelagia TaxID=553151 RepID=UPI0003A8E5EC|nr:FimV/HubP family polar landmark protein [Halopseudomonas pelagia]